MSANAPEASNEALSSPAHAGIEPRAPWPMRHPWQTLAALLIAAVIVLLLIWDWNWFRRPIERIVQAKTGRELHIDGDLDVVLGRFTQVRADRLRFGNAAWSRTRQMASAERLEITFELLPALFKRDVRVPELRLTKPDLLLEVGPDRKGNWVFGGDDPRGMQPQFRRLWIDDGHLRFVDAQAKTGVDLRVRSEQPKQAHLGAPIVVKGDGLWKGNQLKLEGRGESPLDLRDAEDPYRIDVRATAGATRAHARGTLLDPLRLRDFNLQLALAGNDLEDLYPLLGIALPTTPPYTLDGRLTRSIEAPNRSTWKYDGFTGKVGDSDLRGFAHVTAGGGKKPYLKADLQSRRLDFEDLAGFIGAGKPASKGVSNAELQANARQQAARGRIFPDAPFKLEKLRAMDADVRLRATRINTQRLPIDDMDATLALKSGVMKLAPLNFGVADGDIRSAITMDARENIIRTRADIRAKNLTLGKLMPKVKLGKNAIGALGGDVDIVTNGNSIAAMLGNADGDASLGMGQGSISKLLMEYAAIDLAGILKIKLTEDRQIPIRCAFGEFDVRNGVLQTRALAFDTSETALLGSGTISLRDERFDLTLKPKPHKFSPLSLRSPLYVQGSFVDPSIRPDYRRIGLRAVAAAALGAATAPAAALVATTDIGKKGAVYCGGKA